MNEPMIIIWHNGGALVVPQFVADALGLRNGYQIKTDAEFWGIVRANCERIIEYLQAQQGKVETN